MASRSTAVPHDWTKEASGRSSNPSAKGSVELGSRLGAGLQGRGAETVFMCSARGHAHRGQVKSPAAGDLVTGPGPGLQACAGKRRDTQELALSCHRKSQQHRDAQGFGVDLPACWSEHSSSNPAGASETRRRRRDVVTHAGAHTPGSLTAAWEEHQGPQLSCGDAVYQGQVQEQEQKDRQGTWSHSPGHLWESASWFGRKRRKGGEGVLARARVWPASLTPSP